MPHDLLNAFAYGAMMILVAWAGGAAWRAIKRAPEKLIAKPVASQSDDEARKARELRELQTHIKSDVDRMFTKKWIWLSLYRPSVLLIALIILNANHALAWLQVLMGVAFAFMLIDWFQRYRKL